MFSIIEGINESKTLSKHIHANVNINLMIKNIIQIENGITINVCASVKKHHIFEKGYIWNPASCSCTNGKYLSRIIDNSVITCDGIKEAKSN